MIWDVSQQRHSSGIFNCSEERCLITIIEHSGSLQTHLALLIRERNPLNRNSTSAARGQIAFKKNWFINKIIHLRISKRRIKDPLFKVKHISLCQHIGGRGKVDRQ